MASRITKASRAADAAYDTYAAASAALIARTLNGVEDDVTERLRRRAASCHGQWLAAARRLEALTEQVSA